PPLRRLSFPPCSGLATCGKGAPSREPPRPTGALRPLTSPRPAARPSRRGQEGRSMDHRNVVHTSARHRRGTVALTCLLSLVGCALGTAVAGSGAAGASPAVRYVALGDSYTADPGVSGLAPGISPLCLQSSADYPHQVGAAEGFATTDVSCSGATSGDMTSSQYPGVAPQFDSLSPATNAVTVGIGGNDNNLFIGALVSCGILDLPDFLNIGAPCQFVFGNTFANA